MMDKGELLRLVPVDIALRSFVEAVKHRIEELEDVAISSAIGRTLAEDVLSTVRIPRYSTSIWDGYAVRSTDLKGASAIKPIKLRVIGSSFPDSLPSDIKLGPGEATYVTTGAPIPEGADAVVMLEEVTIDGDFVSVYRQVSENENIAPPGEDVEKGIVLKKGHTIRPQDLDLLSSLGVKRVRVLRKPKVAVLSIGSELIEFDRYQVEMERKKADSHALMLISLVEELDCDPVYLGIVPDDIEEIVRRLNSALDASDVVLTVGGAFLGDKDETIKAIQAMGGKLVVHGVKMSPGKVVGLAIIREKPVIALPGLIISLLANFYTFMIPIIYHISGLKPNVMLPSVEARLSDDVKVKPGFDIFQLVKVEWANGELVATPMRGGSGLISNVIKANGFVRVKTGQEVKKGDKVRVTLFTDKELRILSRR